MRGYSNIVSFQKLSLKTIPVTNLETRGKSWYVCITPSGTILFISKCYEEAASDRYITETCGLLDKLNYGDNHMADKGFNISDLFTQRSKR